MILLFMIATTLLIILVIPYTIWDNKRVKIVNEAIAVEGLPDALQGFKILQVSDLHEKTFGKNQEKLISTINSLDYDLILFTGDMMDGVNSENTAPFFNLIDGINNKQHAYYVAGNTDPANYDIEEGTLVKSHFIQETEKRGVKLLESIEVIEHQGEQLNLLDFELSILKPENGFVVANGRVKPKYSKTEPYIQYHNQLLQEINQMNDEGITIALNHYPVSDPRIDQINKTSYYNFGEYDLIIAGHYHGGQIRLPFLGALFIPEPFYENGGFMPPRNRVKGLWEYRGTKQYVSAGLGSSDAINLLNFRLLNTPEINRITLKKD
ncbi:metallophosphoesterase [Halobacillus litoralis]|uniref:metallophosphoesterase n=1 Tax=Halobacillus litoralis TaxID=45668 RepID=UPI001CFDFC52|nr:metallophosphoesterase [Halobacillus litoralis]WLR49461.1 metallophosphoesterase [Halobacillus litoralis]